MGPKLVSAGRSLLLDTPKVPPLVLRNVRESPANAPTLSVHASLEVHEPALPTQVLLVAAAAMTATRSRVKANATRATRLLETERFAIGGLLNCLDGTRRI